MTTALIVEDKDGGVGVSCLEVMRGGPAGPSLRLNDPYGVIAKTDLTADAA
jgi:hypothetical protein